ncbi:MAG: DUF4266 domain-containing protein [Bacteroidales bacterium]|nr:DUF4266 domain-containing protein [Bacteroidales bacterium]
MKYFIRTTSKFISFKMIFIFVLGIIINSCVSVKPYQKAYLNDSEMKLASRTVERFESYFHFYREGSAGANGGKTGGGCGCN